MFDEAIDVDAVIQQILLDGEEVTDLAAETFDAIVESERWKQVQLTRTDEATTVVHANIGRPEFTFHVQVSDSLYDVGLVVSQWFELKTKDQIIKINRKSEF